MFDDIMIFLSSPNLSKSTAKKIRTNAKDLFDESAICWQRTIKTKTARNEIFSLYNSILSNIVEYYWSEFVPCFEFFGII